MILRATAAGFFLLATISCSKEEAVQATISPGELEDYTSALYSSQDYQRHAQEWNRLEAEEAIEMTSARALDANAAVPASDEPFVFFVIGDSELLMRGNTYPQLENWIIRINNMENYNLEFPTGDFDEGESRKISKPQLLVLAGDINKDRAFGFSLPGGENAIANQQTYQLFNQLDDDILFLAGNGNHDWDPYRFGDGSYGNNLGGLLSNLGTAQFVRSTYLRSLNASGEISGNSFNYERNAGWFQPTTSAEFNYSLVYRGIRFTQLNQFLYEPAAMVSLESLFSAGPAWYFPTRSGLWFQDLCETTVQEQTPHVVVQHFPVRTGDGWWNDELGSSPDQLRKRFLDIFEDSYQPVMFTGHNHAFSTTTILPYGIVDYTSGYFANGFVIAVKASAAKGIYAVAYLDLNALAAMDPTAYSATFTVPQ